MRHAHVESYIAVYWEDVKKFTQSFTTGQNHPPEFSYCCSSPQSRHDCSSPQRQHDPHRHLHNLDQRVIEGGSSQGGPLSPRSALSAWRQEKAQQGHPSASSDGQWLWSRLPHIPLRSSVSLLPVRILLLVSWTHWLHYLLPDPSLPPLLVPWPLSRQGLLHPRQCVLLWRGLLW